MRIVADGSAVVGRMVLANELVSGDRAFVLDEPLFLRADDRVTFAWSAVIVTTATGETFSPAGQGERRCWGRWVGSRIGSQQG
ncbi:hypothetical protein [Yinghuangia seranimata]|uniref:hypothetical protein n=1 Tax=Yinghuangia seranimata TaxID=408067 RepID=UPI00248C0138|nr:hypothetical protein [Yinghuangia seranimata]MDI2130384.1 hypothetical protein [Yinghuangia seranimata]